MYSCMTVDVPNYVLRRMMVHKVETMYMRLLMIAEMEIQGKVSCTAKQVA